MSTEEQKLERVKNELRHIGIMGQWYQRYDISKSANDAQKLVEEIQKKKNKE
jgi:hypothetical protein